MAIIPATERMVLRVALVMFCLPLVAMGPLLRVVYGTGDGPQVTLAALPCSTRRWCRVLVGCGPCPQSWSDLVASYGRGRLTTLTTVRARASVPYLFAGLQVAAPAAFLGALVGEFTGAERGVGILIINSMRGLRTDDLWAVATISAAVSMAAYVLVGSIGRRLATGSRRCCWRRRRRGRQRSTGRRFVRAAVEIVISLGHRGRRCGSGLMAWFDLNPYFAKRPLDVWDYLVTAPTAAANRREITDALGSTAQIAIPGYVLGPVLGAGVAAVFDLSAPVRRTVTPFAVALRCVPIVAIAPLLVQAFGRGVAGTTTTVAIMTFFPTLVACSHGCARRPGRCSTSTPSTRPAGPARCCRRRPRRWSRRSSPRHASPCRRPCSRRPWPSGWRRAPGWAT